MIICASPVFAGPKDAQRQSFEVKPGGRLHMEVDRGKILITSGKTDRVEVTVHRELSRGSQKQAQEVFDQHKVEIDQNGSDVTIHAASPAWKGWRNPFNRLNVEYTIIVPDHYHLDLHTGGGSVEITGIQGEVKARTGGGSVTLHDAEGNVDLQSGGGSLHLDDVRGEIVARTGGGSISADSVSGAIQASTGGGNISVNLTSQPKSKSNLRTGGGNVSLTLGRDVAVDLRARTGGGRIRSDFPGETGNDRHRLVARINGGGPEFVVETGGGGIQIHGR